MTVVAALVAGGTVWATIPDGSGVIHGCYKTSSGELRVIDTGTGGSCKPSETALQWSQTGPAGPSGPAGPTGPAGATNVVVRTFTVTLGPSETHTFTALCHAGEVATGGGFWLQDGATIPPLPITITENAPNTGVSPSTDGDTANGWRVVANNGGSDSHDVTAYALCASP